MMGFLGRMKDTIALKRRQSKARRREEEKYRKELQLEAKQARRKSYSEGYISGAVKEARREGYEAGQRKGGVGFQGIGKEILGNIATAGREAGKGEFGFTIPKDQGFTIRPYRSGTGFGNTGFGMQQPRKVRHKKVHRRKASASRKGKTITIRL